MHNCIQDRIHWTAAKHLKCDDIKRSNDKQHFQTGIIFFLIQEPYLTESTTLGFSKNENHDI